MFTGLPDKIPQKNSDNYQSVDEVQIKISMDIIEHFSKNLYRTSTKALEELVTNGYDAAANNVHIYLPGEFVQEKVLVWDDGESMDVEGLKSLWHIAASPKAGTERVIKTRGGAVRNQIGKFGIGKLASYTLGSEISHLCKREDNFYLISIDYQELQKVLPSETKSQKSNAPSAILQVGDNTTLAVTQGSDDKEGGEDELKNESYSQSIYSLSEEAAREYLKGCFKEEATFNDDMFNSESWTCAIIGNLNANIKIQQGMIRRVLGRSMPLKPDFKVFLNDAAIESLLLVDKALHNIDFGNEDFRKKLKSNWKIYQDKNGVIDEIIYNDNLTVTFPNLGIVSGSIKISEKPLRNGAAAKIDRMYGFFVYVKQRLINPEDDLMYLNDPSFATFYRSQFIINCDGLDDALLADRERFSNGNALDEFKILQRSCYQLAAAKWTAETKKDDELRAFKNRLPTHRKELFADPISYLWSKEMQDRENYEGPLGFNLDDPDVQVSDQGSSSDVSSFKFDGNTPTLVINNAHPFFQRLKGIARNNRVANLLLAELENSIAMEAMFEGYLRYLEIDEPYLKSVLNWRESMYRQLAIGNNQSIEGAVAEMVRLSHSGHREFEEAVSNVLTMIGFKSRVEGNAGNPDIVAEAFLGEDTYKLVFETKGSKGEVNNVTAAVAAAPSHAKKVGAEHAVIVAREFSGFQKGDYPAIIQECDAINRGIVDSKESNDPEKGNFPKFLKEKAEHPTVSIMTVDNIATLAFAVYTYRYDLSSIKSIFTRLETPDDKTVRINKLDAPQEGFDFQKLIENIYEDQCKNEKRPFARVYAIYDDYYVDGEDGINSPEELKQKLEFLAYLAYPYVNYTEDRIYLTQKPDIVLTHVTHILNQDTRNRE